jgi:deoxyribonuclease-4
MKKRRLGVHTSIAGGIYLSVERAKQLGCSTMQIFSHNPRQWRVDPIPSRDVLEFKVLRTSYDIDPVFIHSSYLINIAAKNIETYEKSLQLLIQEMDIADLLDADFVVLHTGSSSDGVPADARRRAAAALESVATHGRWNSKLLLENTAGERGDITSRIVELAEIVNSARGDLVGGVCIDTCHAFAAGYNLATEAGLSDFINEVDKYIGTKCVKLIHLNDSRKECNSRVDRHEHIGDGYIGKTNINNFVCHTAFRSVPLILETPKKDEGDDARNLAVVRSFLS